MNATPITDDLSVQLSKRFGENWRQNLTITVRADVLYWMVFLAEVGINAKRTEFSQEPPDVCNAASIGSWQADLEALAHQIKIADNRPIKTKKAK